MKRSFLKRSFFGHPLGLLNVFATEMCERFSYYGMRAILVFYLYAAISEGGLGLSETSALVIMSLFGSLVFLSSIIGGWLSDRVLGPYRSVLYGGVIIALGHVVLGIPFGFAGTVLALMLIVLGTGLLKPNVAALVGALYSREDSRRQAGFSLLYMSVNIGAFVAPLIVGYVSQTVGYHPAFLIPAALMAFGLFVFVALGKSTLQGIGRTVASPLTRAEKTRYAVVVVIFTLLISLELGILGFAGMLNESVLGNSVAFICAAIAAALFIVIFKDKKITTDERSRMLAYIPIFLVATCFIALFEQQSSTIPLIIENYVDNDFGFFSIPASWYAAVNPLIIILLSPVFAAAWSKLGLRQPPIAIKMGVGMVLAAIGFVILGLPFLLAEGLLSPLWIVVAVAFLTVGELFLYPTGLAATTLFSPEIHISKMLALWYIASALGQGLNALTVQFFSRDDPSGFYFAYAAVAMVVAIVIFALNKRILVLAKGVR